MAHITDPIPHEPLPAVDTDSRHEFAFLASLPEGPERRQVAARIVDAWQPTARRLARRYICPSTGREEIRHATEAGLARAVESYVPDRDGAFEPFADDLIREQLLRRSEDEERITDVLGQVSRVRDVVRETLQELERITDPEVPVTTLIAERAGLDEDDVVLGLEVLDSQASLALDTALAPEASAETSDGTLSEHDLHILHMRYFRDLSVDEIADELDTSPVPIARSLARASSAIRALTSSFGDAGAGAAA
jgi:RNA polymerase sigma-B factor